MIRFAKITDEPLNVTADKADPQVDVLGLVSAPLGQLAQWDVDTEERIGDYYGFQGSQQQVANHRKFLSWQGAGVFHPIRDREADRDRSEASRYGHHDATMILVAYRDGLCVSELCDLRWDQIDFSQTVLHVRRASPWI